MDFVVVQILIVKNPIIQCVRMKNIQESEVFDIRIILNNYPINMCRKETHMKNGKRYFYFEQPIPVQSYLIAIAAGALKSKRIGPR